MSLFDRIRDYFRPSRPTLRNRAGGMAWINASIDEGEGSVVLINRIVKMVRLSHDDFWQIDPPQVYTKTRASLCKPTGQFFSAGQGCLTIGIRDHCLTPIPDRGITDEEVADLYAPKLPTKEGQSA